LEYIGDVPVWQFLKHHGKFITAVALAAMGFLLGNFWNVLSSFIQPLGLALTTWWTDGENYVLSHPIEAGLIFAVVGVLIVPVGTRLNRTVAYLFRRSSIIDLVFAREDHVHMVTAHMKQTSFERIDSKQVIQLPSNAPFLPSSAAVSAALIYSYAHERYGAKRTALLHFDDDNWGADAHNFISIGGPFVNAVAREVVEVIRIPAFEITDSAVAKDERDIFAPERLSKSAQPDAALITDYGFIIFTKNPRNRAKRICVAFGLWPPGTQAAVSAILDCRTQPRRLYKQLRKAIVNDHSVIGVVKVRVSGLVLQQGELVKVREF
jgi:hypothetical protein